MAQTESIRVHFLKSGYCVSHENIVNPKHGKGKGKFYAVWALLQLPQVGNILFDTGYSSAFTDATIKFPARFYRWVTPFFLDEKESAASMLQQLNLTPNNIDYVILSHFHADHIAGLKDFPKAKIICSKSAHQEVLAIKSFKAVSKGILHGLLPIGYEKRLLYVEDIAERIHVNNFGITEYQLWGLQDFKLLLLPGHAKGMLGFEVKQPNQHILYATDASWSYDCFKQGILPRKIVKLFFDSWDEYTETLDKLRAYEVAHPGITILFTHCPKTLDHTQRVI